MRTISTDELCQFLSDRQIEYQLVGPKTSFQLPAQLQKSSATNIVWSRSLTDDVWSSPAPVVILPMSERAKIGVNIKRCFVFVEKPRDVFRRLLLDMFAERYTRTRGLLDNRLFEKREHGIFIGRTACVASDTVMGRNVIIHPNATIYPGVELGDHVEILPGAVIGAQGYGHVRQEDGSLEPFPHIGGVHIGNHVTVGSNTCIDSGGLSPTLIGDGVRIGNLTQIAHNVEIGKNCMVGTRVQIAGGTHIGDGTDIWAGVTISNNRRIGKQCDIKIGSVVISHLSDRAVVSGNYAISHQKNLEIYRKVREPE